MLGTRTRKRRHDSAPSESEESRPEKKASQPEQKADSSPAKKQQAKANDAASAPIVCDPDVGDGDGDVKMVEAKGVFEYPMMCRSVVSVFRRLFNRGWGRDVSDPVNSERSDERNMLFGELLPSGAHDLLDVLGVGKARVLYELGAGFCRLALQAFLSCANLDLVVAVELSSSRFQIGVEALKALVQMAPHCFRTTITRKGRKRVWDVVRLELVRNPSTNQLLSVPRVFELCQGDLFEATDFIHEADIVICHAALPEKLIPKLIGLIRNVKVGARLSFVPRYQNLLESALFTLSDSKIEFGEGTLRRRFKNIGHGLRFAASWNKPGTEAIHVGLAL